MPPNDRYEIVLTDYEVANLLAALRASGVYGEVKRNPLFALNSGDWIGQVIQKLEIVPADTNPNMTPDQYADLACKGFWT